VSVSATMVSGCSGRGTLSNNELDSVHSLAGSDNMENSSSDLYNKHPIQTNGRTELRQLIAVHAVKTKHEAGTLTLCYHCSSHASLTSSSLSLACIKAM